MLPKLDFLVRFWELRARHAALGEPLAPAEQIELLSLMQLVTGAEVPTPHRSSRRGPSLSARLIGEGEILAADIHAVSANAILVVANARVAAGSRTCLHAADAVAGVEYVLPCVVTWAFGVSPSTLALLVDGVPSRTVFCEPARSPRLDADAEAEPQPRARASRLSHVTLRIGRRERLLG